MKIEEAKAQQRRASELVSAYEQLEKARAVLDLVRKHVKSGQVWKPTFVVRKGDRYGLPELTVNVEVPAGVIQQQVLDEYKRAKRRVILLGGEVSE